MALDLSRDYLLVDDPVTVAYRVRTGENTWATDVTVDYAQRNELTKEDLTGLSTISDKGLLGKEATVFHLWTARLAGIVPKVNDQLAHDGKTWQVRSVGARDRDANGPQRYRLVCSKVQG